MGALLLFWGLFVGAPFCGGSFLWVSHPSPSDSMTKVINLKLGSSIPVAAWGPENPGPSALDAALGLLGYQNPGTSGP